MKFIYVTCNIAKLEQVLELLKELNIRSYQVIENVNAVMPSGNPRMNSAVWPGSNSIVAVQADKNETAEFFDRLKRMNCEIVNENERVLAVSWDCEKFLYSEDGGEK